MKRPTKRPARPRSSERSARQAAAAELAIAALAFIAGEPERLGRFLALTGIGPESIRESAHKPDFLTGVLDHIAGDEALLLEFARESEIDPHDILRAREAMAGPGWERELP